MPAITASSIQGSGDKAVTVTTLDGSTDTLSYNPGRNPILILNNVTGGSLSPNIVGDAADASFPVQGVGEIDLSTGFDLAAIAAGEVVAVPLNSIGKYLAGTSVTVSGGTGIEASLLES